MTRTHRRVARPLAATLAAALAADIQSATTVAADLLGWSDRAGSVRKGRFVDIVALQGRSLGDIRVLQQPAWVKGGAVDEGKGAVPVR